MTLEGWVNPTQLGELWRTVMLKEQPATSPTRYTRTTAPGQRLTSPPGDPRGASRRSRRTPGHTWP